MKKFFLLFLFFGLLFQAFSWEWEPFGPEGIKANKICFFDWSYTVICLDTGMYFKDESAGEFEFYSYTNMAVIEAVSPNYCEDSLIVILHDGSWSDGIYSFNSTNGQFSVLHYCYNPGFIIYNENNGGFYVGYEYGLKFSEDGITWTEMSFFNNKTCIDMEFSGDYLIVATSEENNNTFYSENGNVWSELEGENITELSGSHWANSGIYGISEGESINGGMYQFDFLSLEWENVFYNYRLNAIGMNSSGGLYVGWFSGISPNEGIAACGSELTFLNDGLPDLNINAISAPMIFGATVIYCCTDGGIFSRVISVGVPGNKKTDKTSIYPNPVSNQATIKVNLTELSNEDITITILTNQGQKADEINIEGNNSNEIIINWHKGDLPVGIYYLVIETGNESISEKFIIL